MALTTMTPSGILETVLYARDLGAIEDFYRHALGLEPFAKAEGRQSSTAAATRCC